MVRTDNACDFGKWLYGDIAEELKASDHYKQIVKLHADFHIEASRILSLALAGKKAEADKEMDVGSKFGMLSSSLTKAMMDWKKGLK